MNGNNNFQMYQNSGYTNNRNRKRTLVLDVEDRGETNLGTTGEFNVELYEPLVVDKHSEIYLDNFTSYNSNLANDVDLAAFSLKINEFNMNSNVASTRRTDSQSITTPGGQHMFNSLIIPNEHRNPDNFQTSVVHKGKKFNYVCDINPGTIHSLSGSITDLIGRPAFHDVNTSSSFTYTIIGIVAGNVASSAPSTTVITAGEQFTATNDINIQGDSTAITGSFPVTTNIGTATSLHFTTNTRITRLGTDSTNVTIEENDFHKDISAANDFFFTIGSVNITVTPNSGMTIIVGHGRFIAEFSIISRD